MSMSVPWIVLKIFRLKASRAFQRSGSPGSTSPMQ